MSARALLLVDHELDAREHMPTMVRRLADASDSSVSEVRTTDDGTVSHAVRDSE